MKLSKEQKLILSYWDNKVARTAINANVITMTLWEKNPKMRMTLLGVKHILEQLVHIGILEGGTDLGFGSVYLLRSPDSIVKSRLEQRT